MKRFLVFLATVALFAACKTDAVFVTLSADSEFVDGKATVNLKLSKPAPDFVDVLISCTPSAGLVFNEQISFNPGAESASLQIDATGANVTEDTNVEVRIKEAIGAVPGNPSSVTIVLKPGNYGGGGGGGEGGEGGGGNGSLQLQNNWRIDLTSEPYTDEYGNWLDVAVTAPGIKYFNVCAFEEGYVEQEEGGLAGIISDWEGQLKTALEGGDAITDYIWSSVEEECYIEYVGAGNVDVYIVEFEADGSATGRYGLTKVVLPEYEASGSLQPADSYVKNTGIGVTYMGRYNDEGEDFDCFTATGVEGKLWSICVDEPGTFDDIAQAAEYAIEEIEDLLADYAAYGFTAMDFLYQGTLAEDEYSYAEYYAFDKGTYDAIVFIFDEDGKMTGEYNLVSVNVDGHAMASAPRPAGKRHVIRRR